MAKISFMNTWSELIVLLFLFAFSFKYRLNSPRLLLHFPHTEDQHSLLADRNRAQPPTRQGETVGLGAHVLALHSYKEMQTESQNT